MQHEVKELETVLRGEEARPEDMRGLTQATGVKGVTDRSTSSLFPERFPY